LAPDWVDARLGDGEQRMAMDGSDTSMDEVEELRRRLRSAQERVRSLEAAASAARVSFWVSLPPYAKPSYLSPSYTGVFGHEPDEASLLRFLDEVHPEDRPWVREGLYASFSSEGGATVGPYRYQHPELGMRFLRSTAKRASVLGEGAVCGMTEDVTDMVSAERTLDAMAGRHEAFLAAADELLFMLHPEKGQLDFVSAAAERYLGVPRLMVPTDADECVERFVAPEDRDRVRACFADAADGRKIDLEHRLISADGEVRWVWTRVQPLHDGRLMGLMSDISRRREAEARLEVSNQRLEELVAHRTRDLEAALSRQRVLAREVHHRVKNNLQIIAGLLVLQGEASELPDVRRVFTNMRARIETLALVHDHLVEAPRGRVGVAGYLSAMVRTLAVTLDHDQLRFVPRDSVADLELDLDRAIPLAMVANELITNAIRHAGDGAIDLSLSSDAEGGLRLVVRDDGPGFELDGARGVGTGLVRALAAQLDGTLTTGREGRFYVSLRIPERPTDSSTG